MANPTMTLIGSPIVVGSGGVSSVTFSSIPATYTDLVIKVSAKGASSASELRINFNGSTSSLTDKVLYGVGASTVGSNSSSTTIRAPMNTVQFTNIEYYVPNYVSSNNKSTSVDAASEDNGTTANGLYLTAGLWSNTAAITSITLLPDTGTFVQYSTFYLYGIASS